MEPAAAEASESVRPPKLRGGRIVPSRYLQYDKKGAGKASSNTSELEKAASPKRPSIWIRKQKNLAEPATGLLQSTVLEGHGTARPDLEFSVVKGKNCHRTLLSRPVEKAGSRKEQTLVPSDPEMLIRMLESQTLLLTYANVKMEKNMALFEEKAEKNLLALCEERGRLRQEVQLKKSRLRRLEKQQELSEALETQTEALSPASERSLRFQEEYKSFATALDSTRHELPFRGVHVGEDKSQFLAELERLLAGTLGALGEILEANSPENAKALSLMRDLQQAALQLDVELPRTFQQVLDLSADVSKEVSLHYQQLCEDALGLEAMKPWYFG
ncbi:HAUS augmin-like complex subunit 8 isoform X2 [Hemicordylus capensis]|uniref:HAUS augmin-like complex subunit 8 isoform X2 n=1 Tax=Hemicordylus capensis TaxID=884348 RepID=UPI0023036071|nr:HAUS augmin-like complex subunit 8 isoform X2 [Hemicordylus capensis]